MPRLEQDGSDRIVVIEGTTTHYFDKVGVYYKPQFFSQEKLSYDPSTMEFVLRGTLGNVVKFHGFEESIPPLQRGTLKAYVDAAGNVTSVTAYTADGKIEEVQRTDTTGSVTTTESFFYEYNQSGPSKGLLAKTTLRRKVDAGDWLVVRTTEQEYYDGVELHGSRGDLKKFVLKDAQDNVIDSAYYRYYSDGETGGGIHDMKMVFRPDSYERLVEAVGDPESADDAQVQAYADRYFEFDDQRRATTVVSQGTGAGGQGTFGYTFETSSNPDGFNSWKFKTTETLPDGNQYITYANFADETMLSVFTDVGTGSGDQWITFYKFDEDGRVVLTANPSAVTGYDESKPDLLNEVGGNYQFLADDAGLITTTGYYMTTTATTTTPGGVRGYVESTSLQNGELGTAVLQNTTQYFQHTGGGATIYPIATSSVYRNEDGTGAQTTSYSYTFFPDTTQTESTTVTLPVVTTEQNGPGVAVSTTTWFDLYGRAIWTRDADGFLSYTEYDQATGSSVKMIQDVDTTQTGDFADLPTGWSTPAGGGLHLTTTMEVDDLGRDVMTTDPNGNVTYTVYNDAAQETRVYSGWNAATNLPTGPTQVYRQDRPGSFSESLTMSAVPDVDVNGRPTGTEPISNIESLARTYTNDSGQVTHSDAYFSLDGMSYPNAGTEGVNFLRTRLAYDERGRQHRTEDPTGTIQRTVFDALGRTASTWIGTDDTPVSGEWSPTNNDGTSNMLKTAESIYDDGDVGDGNLTSQKVFADDSTIYETEHQYDFRNRRTGTKRPDLVAVDQVFDNLGQSTESSSYADLDDDFELDPGELRAKSEADYDELGRVYRSRGYEVDQTTGELGNVLTSQTWYNKRGQSVKTENANGLFSKTCYDGAGRATHQFVSFDLDETAWSEALDVIGDTVIEQSQQIYDPGSRPVASLSFQRFENDTTTTGLLDGGNSYRNTSVMWYDIGNRVTHTATFGRDDGPTYYVLDASGDLIDADLNDIPDVAEPAPLQPDTSDDYIVSQTQYDSAGRSFRTIDNLGRITQTDFDLLGRMVRVIQNYIDGIVTETETDTDVTVEYDYDAAGRMVTLRARNPKGTGNGVEDQDTRYLFESVINRSWQTAAVYPDSSDVLSQDPNTLAWSITTDNGDHTSTTYDRLGRTATMTDQRGVEHTFYYDAAGRMQGDRVTNLGTSGIVDDAVLRIERTYDDMTRVATITSYDTVTGGNVVNQVAYDYNGYGLASVVRQEHDGTVDANTLSVEYNYDDGAEAGQAHYVRLASVEYPDGRLVHNIYPTTGVGTVLSHVEAVADDAAGLNRFAEYSYLGTGTIVDVEHPAVNGGLTVSHNATGNYEGWDRFGRVVNQQWTDAAGTTTLDHYTYTYDRNSNRESRDNVLYTDLSETYGYDGLNRLVDTNRAGSDFQDWTLDGLGNWSDFTDQGTTETRTHNAANELTDIDTSNVIDPVYDAAGNMISGPKPDASTDRQHYKWDAWNRLVLVSADDGFGNPGTETAAFEYDGRNYRIQKTAGGILQAFFHNEGHQVLEVRKDGDPDPSEQYVWDLRYIDAPIVRFHDANTDGTLDDTLYYANDANMNVTALVDALTGDIVERYHYDPHGRFQVYDPAWSTQPPL